jgi:hypothetical protein
MSTPAPYHQTHHVHGLPACPFCGWLSLIVRSFGPHVERRRYYVTCEHCNNSDADPLESAGTFEGPTRGSAEEAGKAFNEAMKKFSASFQAGRGGEW